MGEVYLAEHQLLKRPCALKLIRPEAGADPIALARFEREVQSAARLSHPNTIEIYDYGHTDDGTFYYVMEYLPGISLQDLVKKFGPLPAGRVIYLFRQVCAGLGRGPFAGLGPPRLEAGERFRRGSRGRGRRRQGARLRTGEVDERHSWRRAHERPEGQRHAALHVSRAGRRRPVARRSGRHLRPGLHVVFRPDRSAAVSRARSPFEVMMAHARDPVVPPISDPARRARRPRTGRAPLPGQEARRSLPGRQGSRPRPWPPARPPSEWDADKAQEWWAEAAKLDGDRVRSVTSTATTQRRTPADCGSTAGAASCRFFNWSTASIAAFAPSVSPLTTGLSGGIDRATQTVGKDDAIRKRITRSVNQPRQERGWRPAVTFPASPSRRRRCRSRSGRPSRGHPPQSSWGRLRGLPRWRSLTCGQPLAKSSQAVALGCHGVAPAGARSQRRGLCKTAPKRALTDQPRQRPGDLSR